jgi:hypothetical protein
MIVAQNCAPVTYMQQALANVIAKGLIVNSISDYGYHKEVCVLGTYLGKGQSASFTCTLDAGTTYAFVGGGDNDVTDLDIQLTDSRGIEVAKDRKADNTPIVTYTPSRTGEYTATVKMFSTTTPGSYAAMVILSNDGYTIPLSNLAHVIDDLFESTRKICSISPEMGFISTSNQWAMYGAVLDDQASKSISNIRLSAKKRQHNCWCWRPKRTRC